MNSHAISSFGLKPQGTTSRTEKDQATTHTYTHTQDEQVDDIHLFHNPSLSGSACLSEGKNKWGGGNKNRCAVVPYPKCTQWILKTTRDQSFFYCSFSIATAPRSHKRKACSQLKHYGWHTRAYSLWEATRKESVFQVVLKVFPNMTFNLKSTLGTSGGKPKPHLTMNLWFLMSYQRIELSSYFGPVMWLNSCGVSSHLQCVACLQDGRTLRMGK